jgi:serine/threonine protein kinase
MTTVKFNETIKPTLDEKKPDKDMRAPIVKKEELELIELIATGSFGEVWRGNCRGKEVAAKKLPTPEDEDEIEQILTEMEILIHVRHPSVVLFMGVCIENSVIIVQELMSTDLFSYLRKNDVSMVKKVHIAMQIAEGMTWLHGGKPVILHSDLKPENVLMDSQGNAKICDFGLSSVTRTAKIERDGIIGTPLYMGPEALLEESIDKAADVYSFSVVLWAVLNVQEPFSHIHDYESLVDSVVYRKERPDISDLRQSFPELADLMNRMWAPEPEERPGFHAILDELRGLVAVAAFPGDQEAQNFWKENFNGKMEVTCESFIEGICEHLGVDAVSYRTAITCFKEILEASEYRSVEISKFSKVLDWFGHLGANANDENLLDRVIDIFRQPWFFGPISSKQAQTKLGKGKRGNFLVRVNTGDNSKEEPFRISCADKKGPVHYIVKNKRTKFEINFKKDQKLVAQPDIRETVEIAKKALRLKAPAPGRDGYDSLFSAEDPSVSYIYNDGGEDDSSDDF